MKNWGVYLVYKNDIFPLVLNCNRNINSLIRLKIIPFHFNSYNVCSKICLKLPHMPTSRDLLTFNSQSN